MVRTAKRVGLPSLSYNDEGLRVQDCETKKKGSGLVGVVNVNSVSRALMKNRGGAYVEGGGTKRAGFCHLGEGILQQTGLSAGPKARLSGSEIFGPIPNWSKSPIGQREGSGLKKASKLK